MPANALTATNSNAYVIPLTNSNQTFNISLNSVTYDLTVKWNSFSDCWELYIADDQGNPILSGVPMVTGCDLLEQYEYLGIGGAMVVQSTNNPTEVPDYASLGQTGYLFYLTPAS